MTGRAPLPVGAGVARRRRHLARIRRQIEAGTYRIEAEAVADAIIESLRRARGAR